MTRDARKKSRTPGPPWYQVPRLFLRIRKDPIAELTGLWNEYGDIIRVPVGTFGLFFLAHPQAIRHVLLENQANYSKRTKDYEAMKPVLGEGLLTSDGALWQRQRRAIQPAFRHSEIFRVVELVTRETEETLNSLRTIASRGQALDIAGEMARLTLIIVGKALFGVDWSAGADSIGRAVTLLNQHMAEDAALVLEVPHWIRTARNRRFRNARRTVDREVFERAWDRGSAEVEGLDLLEMLKRARDPETGEAMGKTQVRDEVVTMMAAGHETTANALAWTFYCLSRHPEVAEQLRSEVDTVLNGRIPKLEDLGTLTFTKMVLQESIRLYPPAWGVSRRAESNDVIDGHAIPRGSSMQMIFYLLHRHPDFWEEPERFDPSRFLPERVANRDRFAYLPFGAGHRICIGKDFAMMEAQLILAMVIQRFRVVLAPNHPVALEPVITLRPRYSMWMHLEER